MNWNEKVISVPFDKVQIHGVTANISGTAIMTEDKKQIIAHNGLNYKLVQNIDLYENVLNNIPKQLLGNIINEQIWNNNTRFICDLTFNNEIIEGIKPRLILRNSYDCTLSASVIFGLIKVFCSNGLVIMEAGFIQTFKHVGDIKNKINNMNFDNFIPINDRINSLKNKNITDADWEELEKNKLIPKYIIDKSIEVYQNDILQNGSKMYGLYQAITNIISNSAVSLNLQMSIYSALNFMWR